MKVLSSIRKNELYVINDNAFNFLRLISSIIVIYEHSVLLAHLDLYCLNIRGLAVNIFFILSGFWVTRSYITSKSIMQYVMKRCKKILPQYYLVVLLTAIILGFFSDLPIKEYFTSSELYKYLLANGIVMNFLHPSLPGVFQGKPINGSLWTIKIEILFYSCLPVIELIMLKLKTLKKKNIFLMCLYSFSVLHILLLHFFARYYNIPNEYITQFPAYISYFISGMIYVYNFDTFRKKENLLIIPTVILFSLHFVTKTEIMTPFTLTVIVMYLAFHLKPFNTIGKKNDFSYSMYLFHYPIIMLFIELGYFSPNNIVAIICVFSVTFLFSYLMGIVQNKINNHQCRTKYEIGSLNSIV